MEYIHIKNLEKYHPGYKDRQLLWAKVYFGLVQGDTEFELIEDEVDKWRFVAMICLELENQKPLPNDNTYWKRKGFNIKKRPMSLTLQMLQTFIATSTEVCSDSEINPCIEERREREDKEESKKRAMDAVFSQWNVFASENGLETIVKISPKRHAAIISRMAEPEFDLEKIYAEIKLSEFLRGSNGWKVDFDFVFCSANNYLKILEGKYRNQITTGKDKPEQRQNKNARKMKHVVACSFCEVLVENYDEHLKICQKYKEHGESKGLTTKTFRGGEIRSMKDILNP